MCPMLIVADLIYHLYVTKDTLVTKFTSKYHFQHTYTYKSESPCTSRHCHCHNNQPTQGNNRNALRTNLRYRYCAYTSNYPLLQPMRIYSNSILAESLAKFRNLPLKYRYYSLDLSCKNYQNRPSNPAQLLFPHQ